MPSVAIVDYGLCNLDSIRRAVELCGAATIVARNGRELQQAERVVLPGVGNFAKAMANMRERTLDSAVKDAVAAGKPLLGICLGMQLLASYGEEGGGTEGLGLVSGHVSLLIPTGRAERVPHMGWNSAVSAAPCPLLDGIGPDTDFYFVHSYHLACDEPADVAGRTPYCGEFVSIVQRGRVYGTQFHPEKSQRPGRRLLANFLAVPNA